jgi:hypothetical protein
MKIFQIALVLVMFAPQLAFAQGGGAVEAPPP